MKRARLGFKYDEGLIIKSPETGIAVKVEIQKERAVAASLTDAVKATENDIQSKKKYEELIKKKILKGMLFFYLVIVAVCSFVSGLGKGLIAALYFIALTFFPIYVLLLQNIYAVKYKEKVQYETIFRKIEKCYNLGVEINKDNICIQKMIDKKNIEYIRKMFLAMTITPCILLIPHINLCVVFAIIVVISIIFLISLVNKRLLKILININEIVVYRKPTEQQIENVLFGLNYLQNCEKTELSKFFYWH